MTTQKRHTNSAHFREIKQAIGQTRLLRLGPVFAKLETTNPTGSIKDRMAYHMVRKAEARGELKPGALIIEVTSGNTGISLAMIAAIRGFRFIAVMPDSMSVERRRMMTVFGAELVLTPGEQDMAGALAAYERLVRKHPKAWRPCQFESRDNIEAHETGIGREIVEQTGGRIDAFVAGVGTGGTLLGVARALRKANPKARIIAVEPAESAVLSGRKPGLHKIQGIGEGFVPDLVQRYIGEIDDVIAVPSLDAIEMSGELALKHGLLVGVSSGANMIAALEARRKYRRVVTVLPDRGERYLSFECPIRKNCRT